MCRKGGVYGGLGGVCVSVCMGEGEGVCVSVVRGEGEEVWGIMMSMCGCMCACVCVVGEEVLGIRG